MARGTALSVLLTRLKQEIEDDSTVTTETDSRLKNLLRRTQQNLYDTHDWEHLKVRAEVSMVDGTRYYNYPSTLNFERIFLAEYLYSDRWCPIGYGIESSHMNIWNSDAGTPEEDDPVRLWQHYNNSGSDQFEVWPIPAANASATGNKIRFHGIKNLGALTDNAHTADLDDDLIVLFAAETELNARQRPEAAAAVGNQARTRLNSLRGQQRKSRCFKIGGGSHYERRPGTPLFGRKLP